MGRTMPMLHLTSAKPDMMPFPSGLSSRIWSGFDGPHDAPEPDTLPGRVFAAADTMSRRMKDLARELDCLGYFDDDDSPRAA